MTTVDAIEVTGAMTPAAEQVLTPEAAAFIAKLHRTFNPRRKELLARRSERQQAIDSGQMPDFLPETAEIRGGEWQVAATPDDLQDRRVEITGPVDRKMMINALNSGAKVFMADFEDALSPTWDNVTQGQVNLIDAVRRTIEFHDEAKDKSYELNDAIATLMVRPRGWHLVEKHVLVDGEPISASLFDFGLYFFHNARALMERGSGPYFYLAKLESHLEARLWNDVFVMAQDELGIPQGTIRATVLVETILAAFEMEEILYELRDHSAGLNAGRWDYIFSAIKKFARFDEFALPDRGQVTMTVPFMRAYTELLVRSCHRHGAHAIGGMAAYIPSRRDAGVNERALQKVREDKVREANDGFEGTWVAHPDLVPVAEDVFNEIMGEQPHQKDRLREDVDVQAADLLSLPQTPGTITEDGVRLNINVAILYLNSWLAGNGAAAIYNLMEDTATAEISRAQLWQWIKTGSELEDGRTMTRELYEQLRTEELEKLGELPHGYTAVELLDELVLAEDFVEFLTYLAYDRLP
ncbi:MAG: malate synthase A [Chloroflexi bacterium]|nr:malate synthase A [Chloroflexota bacterium]